jgi:tRNA-intron endonuclease, archaea type
MEKQKIKAYLDGRIITSNDSNAYSIYEKSRFGEVQENRIHYMLSEGIYLTEKGKMVIFSGKKELSKDELFNKIKRIDKRIQIKYSVFKDLRERGYVVKTALKFGADFRVYDKGIKPGKEHARWIVFTEYESEKITWHEFSAKNRVAHSTKKKLLLAIVDEEGDITYYEVGWIKP